MPLLEVTGLAFAVKAGTGVHRHDRPILKDVTFHVDAASTMGLMGESGSGKTTIARCIAGLLTPSSGKMTLGGVEIGDMRTNRRTIGTAIQILFQNHSASLDPRLIIGESLTEGLNGLSADARKSKMEMLLSLVGLSDEILERFPHEISGGQRQRIALARSLSVSPKLLILDEPTSSLDAITQVQILTMIRNIQRTIRLAVLYISHDLATTASISDRIAILHDGVIVEEGTPEILLRSPKHPYTQEVVRNSVRMRD